MGVMGIHLARVPRVGCSWFGRGFVVFGEGKLSEAEYLG